MPSIEHINYIKAPVAVVYTALTTEAGLSQVWTQKLKVMPEIGFVNEFDFDEGYLTKMKIITLEDSRLIQWACTDSDEEWMGTQVSFELSESASKTTILLKHTNWRDMTDYFRWCNYNWAMFLRNLKAYCESKV